MKKQRISRVLDTLETLGEIPKRAVADTLRTFNPLEALNTSPTSQVESASTTEKQAPSDHTPLNVEKVKGEHEVKTLNDTKQTEDQRRITELRSRLFHRVKGEENHVIKREAQAQQQEKEVELTDEQRKQEEIKRRLASHQDGNAPEGKKARGGLFAKKKKRTNLALDENKAEMRGSGKH